MKKTKSEIINHYAITFAVYLGRKMEESQDVRKKIENMDPEELDTLLHNWAEEFVDSEGEDSWEFFDQKMSDSFTPDKKGTVYVVIGETYVTAFDKTKWLEKVFAKEEDASAYAAELQKRADADTSDPELQCDPVKFKVVPKEVL